MALLPHLLPRHCSLWQPHCTCGGYSFCHYSETLSSWIPYLGHILYCTPLGISVSQGVHQAKTDPRLFVGKFLLFDIAPDGRKCHPKHVCHLEEIHLVDSGFQFTARNSSRDRDILDLTLTASCYSRSIYPERKVSVQLSELE